MIIPYYGEIVNIPQGWLLCDGTNGTPDLRGKVLIIGATGGDKPHNIMQPYMAINYIMKI